MRIPANVTNGFDCFFSYALIFVCGYSEGDAAAADDGAYKDIDGSVGTHAKLLAELVEFRLLHGVLDVNFNTSKWQEITDM